MMSLIKPTIGEIHFNSLKKLNDVETWLNRFPMVAVAKTNPPPELIDWDEDEDDEDDDSSSISGKRTYIIPRAVLERPII